MHRFLVLVMALMTASCAHPPAPPAPAQVSQGAPQLSRARVDWRRAARTHETAEHLLRVLLRDEDFALPHDAAKAAVLVAKRLSGPQFRVVWPTEAGMGELKEISDLLVVEWPQPPPKEKKK